MTLDVPHRWVKAHVVIGVRTHIVLDVRVTDENGADCPQFVSLLEGVKAAGFVPSTVVADKAYLSMENYATAAEMGMDAFIPFKVNSVSNEVHRLRGIRTPSSWDRAYHLFQVRRDEFNGPYHQRSNVEAVFGAIKRKLGESLLSRTPLARFNELLAKLLAYNIGIIVHEIHEHGIDPANLGLPTQRPAPSDDGIAGAEADRTCDVTSTAVTEPEGALD